jgi:hypothetical protein
MRHFKKTLAVAILLTGGAMIGYWLGAAPVVQAQNFDEFYIAGDWGSVKGVMSNRLLIFEDDQGTIRIVDPADAHPTTKMLKVERTLRGR